MVEGPPPAQASATRLPRYPSYWQLPSAWGLVPYVQQHPVDGTLGCDESGWPAPHAQLPALHEEGAAAHDPSVWGHSL